MKQTQIVYPIASATSTATSATTTPATKTFAALKAVAAEPHMHLLRDGEVVLYRRQRSRVWQCRYKLTNGAWQRQSTHKTALEHAVRVACDMYDEARFRQRLGLAAVAAKTFADIAAITVVELRNDLAAGTGKKIYADYIRGCTEFCVNGLMAGNRRTSRSGYDRKYKESSTQRPH